MKNDISQYLNPNRSDIGISGNVLWVQRAVICGFEIIIFKHWDPLK